MATRTISNAGGNWSATATWAEGAVPTSADDVVATATSGNLTVDAAAACQSLVLTSYAGTLTGNASITLSVGSASAGNVTFVAAMGVSWGAGFTISLVSTYATGNTLTTAGQTLPILTVNGSGGKWTLGDDLTCAAFNGTLGTLVDNARTVNVAGDIIMANSGFALTSTGYWTQTASGSIKQVVGACGFNSLSIAGPGVTTTLTGNVVVGNNNTNNGYLTIGSGTLYGANYVLGVYARASDPITCTDTTTVGSSLNQLQLIVHASGLTQKAFALPSTLTIAMYIYTLGNSLTATGDFNLGSVANLYIYSAQTGTTAPSVYVDMASYALTCHALFTTLASNRNGWLKLGTSQSHSCAGIGVSGTGTASILDFGSSTLTSSAGVNLTGITVVAGTGTLVMTGASYGVTFAGNSLYNLTAQASMSIADAASVTHLFKCVTGGSTLTWATGVTHALADVWLAGSAGSLVTCAPGTAAAMYNWSVTAFPQTGFSYVSISYCYAYSGKPIVATSNCTDGGSNYGFQFTLATVQNAGFETQGTGTAPYLWPGWKPDTSGGTTIADSATAHTGSHSATIARTTTSSRGVVSQSVAVAAATQYTFAFWRQDTGSYSDMAYAVYDETHGSYIVAETSIADAATWTQFSVNFTTAAGCVSVSLQLIGDFGNSADTLYFDDVAVNQTSSGITGGLSSTLGSLTSSSSGTVKLKAACAKTLGSLTSASSGTVKLKAACAKTLGAVACNATATISSGAAVYGGLSSTLGALTSASSSTLKLQATTARTLGALICASSGTVKMQAVLVITAEVALAGRTQTTVVDTDRADAGGRTNQNGGIA